MDFIQAEIPPVFFLATAIYIWSVNESLSERASKPFRSRSERLRNKPLSECAVAGGCTKIGRMSGCK